MKTGTFWGGALLVAGTAIGGGMLALPVLTAPGGFFPAILIYILSAFFMGATALLFMEVFLWSPQEVNLVSMAQMTLGRAGKIVVWLLYLFFFYSLVVAYIGGGGNLVREVFVQGSIPLPEWSGALIFVTILAPIVALGAQAVDRVNALLMIGLILSFLIFVFVGVDKIIPSFLIEKTNWPFAFTVTPLILASFGFQGTVPTLTNYLGRDPQKVKKAIFLGVSLTLIVYIIWEALILGVVPYSLLQQTLKQEQSAVFPLKTVLEAPWLYRIGEFFAFFALVTSFLGVTLGLLDFLADGLKIKKSGKGRVLLALLVFVPPLIFAMLNPFIFLTALQYGGGIGGALLLGFFPLLMTWRGRYHLKFKSEYALKGGRITLTLLFIFLVFALFRMLI